MRKLVWLCWCVVAVACADEIPDNEVPAGADTAADSSVVDQTTSQTGGDAGAPRVETYQCSELRFTARIDNALAQIELPDRTLQLPHSSTSTGARYTDGSATFWEENGRASLELPEGSYHDCERAPPVDVIPSDTLPQLR